MKLNIHVLQCMVFVPPPVPPFPLAQSLSPKDIAKSGISQAESCMTHILCVYSSLIQNQLKSIILSHLLSYHFFLLLGLYYKVGGLQHQAQIARLLLDLAIALGLALCGPFLFPFAPIKKQKTVFKPYKELHSGSEVLISVCTCDLWPRALYIEQSGCGLSHESAQDGTHLKLEASKPTERWCMVCLGNP